MTFEHFALIWPLVGISLVAGIVYLVTGLRDRAERRKAR